MRVAVLGGGTAPSATAGDLALRGHDVRLALRNRERFAEIFATRRIRVRGLIDGEAEVGEVTDDHTAAVEGADLVVVPLPAFAQEAIAERVAPALEAGQVVYLTTGTFGSYVFREALRRAGAADVPVAERDTPLWRPHLGPCRGGVGLLAAHLPTGVYPASRTEGSLAPIRRSTP